MNCQDFELAVDAYLDRELGPDDTAAAHAHLASCVPCGRLLAERMALGRLVRAIPYHTAPAKLRAAVAATNRSRLASQAGRLRWAAAIAALVSLGAALAGLRIAHDRQANETAAALVAEAIVDDHVRALADGHLFDVRSSDQHTVKPWFLGKITFSPPVEDLASIGFPLAGGRLGSVQGQPAAVLVYQRRLHPIEVFIRPASPGSAGADAARSIRGFQVRSWAMGDMSFLVVSDLNADELQTFVRALKEAAR